MNSSSLIEESKEKHLNNDALLTSNLKKEKSLSNYFEGDFIKFKVKPEETEEDKQEEIPYFIKFNYKVPWLSEETKKHTGMIRLHYEILDFYNFMKPTEDEDEKRRQTIKELKDLIKANMKDVSVKTFGSFPNRLHLPDSDIDIVVFSNLNTNESEYGQEKKILEKISSLLINNNKVDYIKKIEARVPILKIKMKSTGIYMDIW